MRRPRVTLVVAAAENDVIGRDGGLPWRLPADLRRFKQLTMGHPIVMGRRTWDSLGRALPGRHNIVVSRRADFAPQGATVARSWAEAMSAAGDVPEVMVIGGAELYALALPDANAIELTRVHARIDGDTRLPALDPRRWREVKRETLPAGPDQSWPISFVRLERVTR